MDGLFDEEYCSHLGVIDVSVVDTTPGCGSNNPLTPPAGFSGGRKQYLSLCYRRFRHRGMSQVMYSTAKYFKAPSKKLVKRMVIRGPYAEDAKLFLNTLK